MELYILLLSMFFKMASPYSSGAPTAACGDMTPRHGVGPQTSTPPYTISPANSTVAQGDKLLIEIKAKNTYMEGFFIQAQDSKNAPIGAFHSSSYQIFGCADGTQNAITHRDNSKNERITFQWQPPQNFVGDVTFKATLLRSEKTFWTNLASNRVSVVNSNGGNAVTERNDGTSNGNISPATETLPEGIQKLVTNVYNDCGLLKSCFGLPAQCVDKKSCNVLATFTKDGDKYEFELLGKRTNAGQYIAIGFGDDTNMGDDYVVVCSAEDGKMDIYNTWNDKNDNIKVNDRYGGLTPLSTGFSDDTMYCSFRKSARTVVFTREFNFDEKTFYVLLSAGSFSGGMLRYHGGASRLATDQPIALGKTSKLNSNDDRLLKLIHGCLMIAAWVSAASCGMLLPRYYKKTWLSRKIAKKDIWFQFHRFFMISTWCLTVSASIIIVYSLQMFRISTHSIVGVISVVLCFVQPFMAALRPHPGTPNRSIFNWLHWLVGNSAQILGISAIFLGFEMYLGSNRNWVKEVGWYTLICFIIFHILIHLILTFGQCITDKKMRQNDNSISFPMKDLADSRMPLQTEERPDAPLSFLRKLILAIYLPINWFATALLIIYLVVKKEEIENTLTSWGMPSFWEDIESE